MSNTYSMSNSYLMDTFDTVGNSGPVILMIFSFYLLRNKKSLFYYYIIGLFLNALLNLVLKGLFKMPRPLDDIKTFNLALKNGDRFIFKNGVPHDIFGMPSGHTQSAIYSTTFVFLALKDYKILILYVFISLITMCQRVYYKWHTILQVIVGGIIGFIFGKIMFYLCKKNIMGLIREKKDDNAPL